jgi:hypothetical protein
MKTLIHNIHMWKTIPFGIKLHGRDTDTSEVVTFHHFQSCTCSRGCPRIKCWSDLVAIRTPSNAEHCIFSGDGVSFWKEIDHAI